LQRVHQSVLSRQSSNFDREREHEQALIIQSERLCESVKALNNAVLARLGLPIQQEPLLIPQPPTGHKQRPESCVRGRRLKPVAVLPTLHAATKDPKRIQRQSAVHDREELFTNRDQSVSPPVSVTSENTLRSADTETPRELRTNPFICSPVEESTPYAPFLPSPPPTPAPPQHKRRICRLPVMKVPYTGTGQFFCRQNDVSFSQSFFSFSQSLSSKVLVHFLLKRDRGILTIYICLK